MDKKNKKEKDQLIKPTIAKDQRGVSSKNNFASIEGMVASGNVFNQLSKIFMKEIEDQRRQKQNEQDHEPELINNFDQNVLKILSMINKKSDVTKLKGLNDLKLLIEQEDLQFIEKFFPNFVFLYNQFTQMELPNSKNLIILNQILKSMVEKGKQYLKNHFKKIFFYWYLNINDSNLEIKSAATKAFQTAFQEQKQEQAIILCQNEYIECLQEYFDIKNQNEIQAIQERILYAAISGLGNILKILKNQNRDKFIEQVYEKVIGEMNIKDQLGNILSQKKGTKIIAAFIDLMEDLFQKEEYIKQNIQFLTIIVSDNIMIDNDYIQKSLWKYGLVFVLTNIQKFELKIDLSQKILDNIRVLGYQIGGPFFENLVIVLSLIKVNANFNKFVQQMFDCLRKGLQMDENRFFGDNIITSHFECCQFLIQKRQGLAKVIFNSIKNLNQDFIDLNDYKKINQIQFRSIPLKFAQFVISIQSDSESIKNILENLQELKISNKYNFNQILSQLGQVRLNNESLDLYIKILQQEYEAQTQQIQDILNNKIQNNKSIQELSEKIQEFCIFITNAKQFINQKEDFYMNIIKLFFQNIYHYNDLQYIENFIQYISKIINQSEKDYIFEKYLKNQNQKHTIILSYLIDQNLQDNIFTKNDQFQFQELEIAIKKQKNIESKEISQQELKYIYKYFEESFKQDNQQNLLILFNLIKSVSNLDLNIIIENYKINYNSLYSLLYIFAKTQKYQYFDKFYDYCYQIQDLQQIDQLFKIIQKKELIQVAITGFIKQLDINLNNLAQINLSVFTHISKQFLDCLKEQDLQDQLSQIFKNHIYKNSSIFQNNIDEVHLWEFLEQIIDIENIQIPKFVQENFKIYSILLCINRGTKISKKSNLQLFYSKLQDKLVQIIIKQEEFENFYDNLFDLCKIENLIYLNGLKTLAIQKQEQILQIFSKKINQYNDDMTYLLSYQILPLICNQFQQIYINCDQKFMSELGLKLSVKNIDIKEEDYENINKSLFENLQSKDFNFLIFFKYLNFMIEKGNIVYFGEHIQKIEEIFFQFIKIQQSEHTFLTLLEIFAFIRKISNLLELFTNEFQLFIKRDFYIYCSEKLNQNFLFQQGDYFIIDMAETINRLINQIDQNLPVNDVFIIMNSDYQSLQKAGFLTLYHYFNNVQINEYPQIAQEDIEDEDLEKLIEQNYYQNSIQNLQIEFKYKYLLNWILLIQNSSQQQNKCQNYVIISRMARILVEKHYIQFLNIMFEEKNQSQVQKLQSLEDSLIYDNLFQLQMNALIVFTTNYPVNVRNYFEICDKKYIKQAEHVLKNYIGPQLFQSEIEMIELKQHDWKTEEFDIYVYSNTREINAIYIKESQELQISLKVPVDYPRKQIKIDVNKGVKIDANKIKKWILRMKALLINQNNSIINSLMLWKQNIDKEFLNIEECPICYFVIHSGTRQLPKLACKTCKHKFHSACIHKWFQTSNKSECPLCKSQFL